VQRDADDRTLLTLALIETCNADDLSPVDEARGYERLIAEFKLAQQGCCRRCGPRPLDRRECVATPQASRSRAADAARRTPLRWSRARVTRPRGSQNRERTWPVRPVAQGLSVREVEDRVRGGRAPERRPRMKRGMGAAPEVRSRRRRVCGAVSAPTRASPYGRKAKDKIHLSFYSNDDLARLLELILGAPVRRMTTRGVQRLSSMPTAISSRGNIGSHGWPWWRGKWAAMGVVVLVVLFFAFAGPITRSAARVPRARARGVASPGRETVACSSSPLH